MGRRNRSPFDAAETAVLLRVRRLVFETLERRSMLAADADALDGADSLDAGECEADFGGEPDAAFVAFPGEERIEPEIAGCWLPPPEAWCFIPPAVEWPEQPEAGLFEPAVAEEELEPSDDQVEAKGVSTESDLESIDEAVTETGDDADAVPLWEGVSLEVIRSTEDDLPPTVIADPASERDEPQVVICTGGIDWGGIDWGVSDWTGSPEDTWQELTTFPVAFATSDGSEPTLVLSGPSESGDESVFEESVFEESETGIPKDHGLFGDGHLGWVKFFKASGNTAPSADSTSVSVAADPPPVVTAAADVAADVAAEPEETSGSPVAAIVTAAVRTSYAPVAAGSAEVVRLFAAYASGLGQGAADHLAATIGGRRGTRR